MMDIVSTLSDPIVYLVVLGMVASVAGIYVYSKRGGNIDTAWVLERLKPGLSLLDMKAKVIVPKSTFEPTVVTSDKRKLLLGKENKGSFETVITKDGKQHKLWLMENGNIVKLNGNLAEPNMPLLDGETVTAVNARVSARRLAAPKLPKGDLYTWLIMGAIAGVALGYIIYPQVNHPQAVVEYCKTVAGAYQCGLTP